MKNIIGRKSEIKRFSEYLESGKAEFVVVYGRRRVGKTFLVREFFDNQFTFYLSGAENATKNVQLFNFNSAINSYSKANYPLVDNWQNAFLQLEEYLDSIKKAGRKVIFIDELPWLDNAKSGFLSAFEYFWNTYASARKDIFLVVCGSATSWVMNKIIKNRGGLHNRVSRQLFLEPFTLNETEQFFQSKKLVMNRFQIAECYMIMGGVPYYLEQLERSLSLSQNIDNLFFANNAILRNEYSKLYASLFKNPEKYLKIIEVLAQKRKSLTRDEIIKLSKIPDGGGLTSILEELELCGFISINANFDNHKKNRLYQLVDFYSLFYLNFVKNKKGTDSAYWSSLIDNSVRKAWSGYSFELLCQTHIPQIKKALGISGVLSYVSGWRSRDTARRTSFTTDGAQIDLLIDRNDNIINLCEMKYANKEFVIAKNQDANLRNKRAAFIEESHTRKTVHLTLVTTYGVKHNEYWNNIQSEIVLDDLFVP
jgi:AAA+ ATPase superfamily predicted ATPase